HYYGQFKSQAETESEPRYERIIFLHRPVRSPAERLRVMEKKEDRFGQQPKIAKEDPSKKEGEANADGREQDFLLHHRQRWKNKFGDKKQKYWKGDDDTGVKREMK